MFSTTYHSDGDVILCAQAEQLARRNPQDEVIVATTNVGHLARFVTTSEWHALVDALDSCIQGVLHERE